MRSALTLVLAVAIVAVPFLSVTAQMRSPVAAPRPQARPLPPPPPAIFYPPFPERPAPPVGPTAVYPLVPTVVYPLPPVPPTPPVEPAPEITLPNGRWERHGDGVASPHVWVWIPTYRAEPRAPEAEPSQPTSRPVR